MGPAAEPRDGAPVDAPRCPRCARELAVLEVYSTRNRWGGGPPRLRQEQWWQCPAGDWLGYRHADGDPLRPVRRLAGAEGDCFFCGDEECNVAGVPWQQEDGSWRDWLVCLSCGTSNPRRLRFPPPPDGAPG
ncbi:hypothetical protein AB0P12_09155 [Streptomyces subrutilus]|uniref:hypothetical protein n=1 Tax=Streptomyces subrutilus TaxID=36818 RepID=UPI0033F114B2